MISSAFNFLEPHVSESGFLMAGQEKYDDKAQCEADRLCGNSESFHSQTRPVIANKKVFSAANGDGMETKANTQHTNRNVRTAPQA